jgi:lipopolysaccharide export system permease protein
MKRLDRLVIRELFGPFGMGLGLFGTLLFASAMLNRVTEWIVQGIAPARVLEMSLLLSPAILVKSGSMACLLAALLAFGRLSNDSEIVAIRAAGASLYRVMWPVLIFSSLAAAAMFTINETFVPWASDRANALSQEVKRQMDGSGTGRNIIRSVKMQNGSIAMLSALDFSLVNQTLHKASLVIYSNDQEPAWWLQADEMQYFDEKDWRISGKALLISADGSNKLIIEEGAWPTQIDSLTIKPRNLLAGFVSDLDVFSMKQISEEISIMRAEPTPNYKQLANLEFGYWNKLALPMSTIIFALLGAPLGIRNQRTGMGAGFALSIVVTFGYIMIANWLAVYAKGGAIPPYVASFTPVVIGGIAAFIAMWRKNN